MNSYTPENVQLFIKDVRNKTIVDKLSTDGYLTSLIKGDTRDSIKNILDATKTTQDFIRYIKIQIKKENQQSDSDQKQNTFQMAANQGLGVEVEEPLVDQQANANAQQQFNNGLINGGFQQPAQPVQQVVRNPIRAPRQATNRTALGIKDALQGKITEKQKKSLGSSLARKEKREALGIISKNNAGFQNYIDTLKSVNAKRRATEIFAKAGAKVKYYLNSMISQKYDNKDNPRGKPYPSRWTIKNLANKNDIAFFRTAKNIIRLVKSANRIDNMNDNNLTDIYIEDRNKLNVISKTNNPSVILKKISDRFKKYGTLNEDTVLTEIDRKLEIGAANQIAKIENAVQNTTNAINSFDQQKAAMYDLKKAEFNLKNPNTVTSEQATQALIKYGLN